MNRLTLNVGAALGAALYVVSAVAVILAIYIFVVMPIVALSVQSYKNSNQQHSIIPPTVPIPIK